MNMSDQPLILLTNDDGVAAPGIRAAREALAGLGQVMVAAPDRERSAASHSISLDRRRPEDVSHAAHLGAALAEELLRRGDKAIPDASLLSVNFPAGPITGYRVTFLGRRVYRDQVEVRQDLRGRAYYWIGGPEE